MDRKEFLASVGLSAASFALVSCLGCSKSSDGFSFGAVTGGPAPSPLTVYKTALTGTSLKVYS